jgi:hypothetical protein
MQCLTQHKAFSWVACNICDIQEETMSRSIVLILMSLALTGCASIIEGTSQEVSINTNPAGADCAMKRQDLVIARVNPTPGAATIKKTKYDITILCNKVGYQEATYLDHSGSAGATWGNIVAGGGIGWAIDSASGADNKYDSPVNITLVPVQTVQAVQPVQPTQIDQK